MSATLGVRPLAINLRSALVMKAATRDATCGLKRLLPHLGIHFGTGIVPAIIGATIGAIVLLLILKLAYRRGRW